MPPTPALNAHDDYHLEPIFHRYDIDAIIAKLLKGKPIARLADFALRLTAVASREVRGGPTDVAVQLTFEEIKYLCLAARSVVLASRRRHFD
jgi:hypothetical protein